MATTIIDPAADAAGAEVDPATPESRLALARRIILAAVGRYEAAVATAWEIDLVYPDLKRIPTPHGPEAEAEQGAWRRVIAQARLDFDAAEMGLAEAIQLFYDDFATADQVARIEAGEAFVERGVRVGSTTYILSYDVNHYEPGTNIIAILRDGLAIDF